MALSSGEVNKRVLMSSGGLCCPVEGGDVKWSVVMSMEGGDVNGGW